MKNKQLAALQAIDVVIAAYPPSVQACVLEGVVVAALDTLYGVDASRWLDEQAGALALVQTRAQLERVLALEAVC